SERVRTGGAGCGRISGSPPAAGTRSSFASSHESGGARGHRASWLSAVCRQYGSPVSARLIELVLFKKFICMPALLSKATRRAVMEARALPVRIQDWVLGALPEDFKYQRGLISMRASMLNL